MGFPYHGELAKHNKQLKAEAKIDTTLSSIRIAMKLITMREFRAAHHILGVAVTITKGQR